MEFFSLPELIQNNMNLKDSQLDVDNWIKEHGVRYFNELTIYNLLKKWAKWANYRPSLRGTIRERKR
jgi:hypothetical protein